MKKYNISKAASILNVTAQTLRNWDKSGFLKPSIVTETGYRYYTEADINAFYNKNYLFEKLDKVKVFRDPLYGNISVEYKLIWDLIDTKEVQRLRRIRQLSGVSMVFHTAEHSRFCHALGTYHIANRMCNEVVDLKNALSEYEKIVFLAAALLHDVGHGPYSHAFEHVFGLKHERISCEMIENKNTEINKVLAKYPCLATDIAGIIRHDGKYPLIESLITSQLDVDRLDYLNRDANFTGATYGVVDVDRLIRVMRVVDGQVCYNDKGVHAIENYLMSRYHMYWQIYYHPVARSYEIILESIYKRIKDMIVEGKKIEADVYSLINVFKTKALESYIDIDDAYVNGMIKQLTKAEDDILRDLAISFEKRHLYNYLEIETEEQYQNALKIKDTMVEELGKYYFLENKVSQTAYLHVATNDEYDINDIKILTQDGDIKSLEDVSPIINGLIKSATKTSKRILF